MSAEKASSIEARMFTVYVQLLDEGTIAYRPVPASKEIEGVCILGGQDIYDEEVETWEFPPGSRVSYEPRKLDGDIVFVATGIV